MAITFGKDFLLHPKRVHVSTSNSLVFSAAYCQIAFYGILRSVVHSFQVLSARMKLFSELNLLHFDFGSY
jgi:hypothetical protein